MWDEYLVARLSPVASQVLLSLLLSRSVEVRWTQAEFAIRTGLNRRSISKALAQLEAHKLILIVPQRVKPDSIRLSAGVEYATVKEIGLEEIATVPDRLVLEAPIRQEPRQENAGRAQLIERCRNAKTEQDKVLALQSVWGAVFPVKDYSSHRLMDSVARKWLGKYPVEVIAEVIFDAAENARERIEYPRAFIERALVNYKPDKKPINDGDGGEITDGLRELARLAQKQLGYTDA